MLLRSRLHEGCHLLAPDCRKPLCGATSLCGRRTRGDKIMNSNRKIRALAFESRQSNLPQAHSLVSNHRKFGAPAVSYLRNRLENCLFRLRMNHFRGGYPFHQFASRGMTLQKALIFPHCAGSRFELAFVRFLILSILCLSECLRAWSLFPWLLWAIRVSSENPNHPFAVLEWN